MDAILNWLEDMSVVRALGFEAILLVGVVIIAAARGWRLLVGPRRKTGSGPTPGCGRLEAHLELPIRRLAWDVLLAYSCWCVFYLLLWWGHGKYPHPDPSAIGSWMTLTFVPDLLTNLTTTFLVLFYYDVSAFSRSGSCSREHSRGSLVGWVFLVVAITLYELLSFMLHARALPFRMIYGLGQATALFLVTGRLDSSAIRDHIAKTMPRSMLSYRTGIFLGYLYASIQPLYPLFDEESSLLLGLILAACFLKIAMLGWLDLLFQPSGNDELPSPIANHVYETSRFVTEEMSSFERTFLRKHFNPIYLAKYRERKIGYLGIEYSYLNEYKRERMGLTEPEGGILVREVYPGTSAMNRRIRVGDFITRVNGMPLGIHNRLSSVLVGISKQGPVEVEYLRKQDPCEPASIAAHYRGRRVKVRLHDYERLRKPASPPLAGARLGLTFLYNSLEDGVVCVNSRMASAARQGGDREAAEANRPFAITGIRNPRSGRYHETPDLGMLRVALGQLVPGERVSLTCRLVDTKAGEAVIPRDVSMASELERESPAKDAAPRPRAWYPMKDVHRARLHRIHADRFHHHPDGFDPGGDPLKPELVLWDDEYARQAGGTFLLFDERLARLFEYHCTGPEALRTLSGLKIWRAITPGRVHVFVGGAMRGNDDGEIGFAEGAFLSAER